jgi:formylglycine-generating enzyme required for sulfatase activity/serine/threonine protein kinase/Leucine-rich repeat (LRR) protein
MKERELFETALEIDDPAARLAHLHAKCAGDTDLLARVAALLASHEGQSQFLNIPVVEQMADITEERVAATMICGNGSTQDDEPDATAAYYRGPATMTENSDDSDDEIPLGYLEPSTKPGSLGRLGHYEVLEVIGRGAFGTVLRAFDEKLQRVVAIKVMASELAATSPARKRFLREAQASAAIRHEHVVSIYAVEEKPIPYLVMEYIPGQTLQQRIDERGPLDVPSVLRLGRQIAEGLAAAHGQDLIHRDIKPGNILLETGVHDRVKITDFGLARAADDASLTQSGTIAGTPMYMAPEQALGHKLDQRADLFSFGSVLYQLVSGRPPFRAPSVLAVLKRVAEEVPRPIQEIIPETPNWLCDIIAKLHAKNPDDRYQSAQEVAEVLADCEAQLKAHAKLKDLSRIPRSTQSAAGKSARRKWVAVAALLLPVLALTTTEILGITHLFQRLEQGIAVAAPDFDPGFAPQINPQFEPSDSTIPPRLANAPFDAAQARAHQEAWAKHLGVPVEYTNSIGMKFVLIPPGEFQMGSSESEIAQVLTSPGVEDWMKAHLRSESRARRAAVRDPFWIGIHEVTIGQFRAFVKATNYQTEAEKSGGGFDWSEEANDFTQQPACVWNNPKYVWSELQPVAFMGREDVDKFCAWLSENDGRRYGIPTGEQWEFACRAGSTTRFFFGDDETRLNEFGCILPDSGYKVTDVGKLGANPFGLFDTLGNADELTVDRSNRLIQRGGNGRSVWQLARSATGWARQYAQPFGGFRVVVGGELGPRTSAPASNPVVKQEPLPPTFKNSIGMEFVIVPKGKSWLGGGGSKNTLGGKEVKIPADFYLGKYEVTQEEWEKVMGDNPSQFSREGRSMDAVKDVTDADLMRFPVENVSWDDCQVFVAKLNKLEKETGWVYRLPKEVEWEYACRGGPMSDKADSAFDFYFAKPTQTLLPEQANFKHDKGPNRTCRVGSYQPNVLGLYDMHGNAWEWCDDTEKAADGASHRVIRSASWGHVSGQCRATDRYVANQLARTNDLGLRLARVPSSAPSPEAQTAPTVATFTNDDVQRIATLPAAEQIAEVRNELMRRNPGFLGSVVHKIKGGVVTELTFNPVKDQDVVTDLSPVRALKGLTSLNLENCYGLGDLEPLKGLKLTRLRTGGGWEDSTQVRDLKPLKDMQLTELSLTRSHVRDLEPLRGMPLTSVNLRHCRQVRDLSPLKGMNLTELWIDGTAVYDLELLKDMPLNFLDLGQTAVQDLEPLKGMKLTVLNLGDCGRVQDLEPLKGMPLTNLDVNHSQVRDLEPVRGMPLRILWIHHSGVTDLTPLQGIQLEDIRLTPKNIAKGLDILRDMKSLKTIGISWDQSWPAAEFWQRYDKGEFRSGTPSPEVKTPAPAVAPFTDADVQRIAALPAEQQIEEVRKELMRRNPGFDGKLEHKIEDGVVTEFRIVADNVTEIAPIRVWSALRVLECRGKITNMSTGLLADLTSLKGMNLADLTLLNLRDTKVSDAGLEHFKDCTSLTTLILADTQVGDAGLAYFRNCKALEHLDLGRMRVGDAGLDHFADCKALRSLWLCATNVDDAGLSPFRDCTSLTSLDLSDTRVSDAGLAHFQDCKALTRLWLAGTQVSDAGLAYFKGTRLLSLWIDKTGITDLTPLQDMPLEDIRLTPKNITRGLDILRDMKNLKTIGVAWNQSWPAAEFWERYDKGEFKE